MSHTYAAAGSYTVTLTLTDTSGNTRTLTRTIDIPVSPPPAAVTPPTPKPVLSKVGLTRKSFHVVGSGEKPRAGKVRLTLNTPAKVVIVLTRTAKVNGKVVTAKLTKALPAGGSKVRLTSKIGRTKLKPGTYKVTVRASNTAGRTSAKAGRLRLLP